MKKLTLFVLSLGLAFGSFAQMNGVQKNAFGLSPRSFNRTVKTVKSGTAVKDNTATISDITLTEDEQYGMTVTYTVTCGEGVEKYAAFVAYKGYIDYLKQAYTEQDIFRLLDSSSMASEQNPHSIFGTPTEGGSEEQQTFLYGGYEYEINVMVVTGTDSVFVQESFESPTYQTYFAGTAVAEAEWTDKGLTTAAIQCNVNEETFEYYYILNTVDQLEGVGVESADDLEAFYEKGGYRYFSTAYSSIKGTVASEKNPLTDGECYAFGALPINGNMEYGSAAYVTFCAGEDVSIENVESLVANVYPNPATETIKVSAQSKIEVVELINTLGQVVYSDNVNATSASINVANFEKGSYVVRVISENGVQSTTKVLVK